KKPEPKPWLLLISGLEPISHPRFRDDVPWSFLVGFKLFSQVTNEHAQVLWLRRSRLRPHRRQQNAVGDHLTRMARKIRKKLKFLRRELYLFVLDLDAVRFEVDVEISDVDCTFRLLFLGRRSSS